MSQLAKERANGRLVKIGDTCTPTKRGVSARDRFHYFPLAASCLCPAGSTPQQHLAALAQAGESKEQAADRELYETMLRDHLPALTNFYCAAVAHVEREVERNDTAPFQAADVVAYVVPPLNAIVETCFALRNALLFVGDAAADRDAVATVQQVLGKVNALFKSKLFFGPDSNPMVRRSVARAALLVNAMNLSLLFDKASDVLQVVAQSGGGGPDAAGVGGNTAPAESQTGSNNNTVAELKARVAMAASAIDWDFVAPPSNDDAPSATTTATTAATVAGGAASAYKDPFGGVPRYAVPHGKAAVEVQLALKEVLAPVCIMPAYLPAAPPPPPPAGKQQQPPLAAPRAVASPSPASPSLAAPASADPTMPLAAFVRAVQCVLFDTHVYPRLYESATPRRSGGRSSGNAQFLPAPALHATVVLHFLRPLLVHWAGDGAAGLWCRAASVARVLCMSALISPASDGARLSTPGTSVAGLRTLCKVASFAPAVEAALLWLVTELEGEQPPCRSLAVGLDTELSATSNLVGPEQALLLRHGQSWAELMLEVVDDRLAGIELGGEDARRIVWVLGFLCANCARVCSNVGQPRPGAGGLAVRHLAAAALVGSAEKFWAAAFIVAPPHLDAPTFSSIAIPILSEVGHYLSGSAAGTGGGGSAAAAAACAAAVNASGNAAAPMHVVSSTTFVDMLAAFVVNSATMMFQDMQLQQPTAAATASPSANPSSPTTTTAPKAIAAAVAAAAAMTAAGKQEQGSAAAVSAAQQQALAQAAASAVSWPQHAFVGDARLYLGPPPPVAALIRTPSLTFRALVQWIDDTISAAEAGSRQSKQQQQQSGDEPASPTTRGGFARGSALGDMHNGVLLRAVSEACLNVLLGPSRRRVNAVSLANVVWTCLVRACGAGYVAAFPRLAFLAAEATASLLNHSVSFYGEGHDPEVANRLVTALVAYIEHASAPVPLLQSSSSSQPQQQGGGGAAAAGSPLVQKRAQLLRHLTVLRLLNRLFPGADGFTCIAEQPRTAANLELVSALIHHAPQVLRYVAEVSALINADLQQQDGSGDASSMMAAGGSSENLGGAATSAGGAQQQQQGLSPAAIAAAFPVEFKNLSAAILGWCWQWHFRPSIGVRGAALPLADVTDTLQRVCDQGHSSNCAAATVRSAADWMLIASHLATVVLDHVADGVRSNAAVRLTGVALAQLCRIAARSDSAQLSAHISSAFYLIFDGMASGLAAGRCSPELAQSLMRFVVLSAAAVVARQLPQYATSADAPARVLSALTTLLHAVSFRCGATGGGASGGGAGGASSSGGGGGERSSCNNGSAWGAMATVVEIARYCRREMVQSFFVGQTVAGVELLVAKEPNSILRPEDILLGPTTPAWAPKADDDDTDGGGEDGDTMADDFASPLAGYNPSAAASASSPAGATAATTPPQSSGKGSAGGAAAMPKGGSSTEFNGGGGGSSGGNSNNVSNPQLLSAAPPASEARFGRRVRSVARHLCALCLTTLVAPNAPPPPSASDALGGGGGSSADDASSLALWDAASGRAIGCTAPRVRDGGDGDGQVLRYTTVEDVGAFEWDVAPLLLSARELHAKRKALRRACRSAAAGAVLGRYDQSATLGDAPAAQLELEAPAAAAAAAAIAASAKDAAEILAKQNSDLHLLPSNNSLTTVNSTAAAAAAAPDAGGAVNLTELLEDLESEMVDVRGDEDDATHATSLVSCASFSGGSMQRRQSVAGHEDADANLVAALNQSAVFSSPSHLSADDFFAAGNVSPSSKQQQQHLLRSPDGSAAAAALVRGAVSVAASAAASKKKTGLSSSDDDDDDSAVFGPDVDVLTPAELYRAGIADSSGSGGRNDRWPWASMLLDGIGCVTPTEHPCRRILPWRAVPLRVLPSSSSSSSVGDGASFLHRRLRSIPTHRNRCAINIVASVVSSSSGADPCHLFSLEAAKLLLRSIVETPYVGGTFTELSADGLHGLRRTANEEFFVHIVPPHESHACFRAAGLQQHDAGDGVPLRLILCPVATHRHMYETAASLESPTAAPASAQSTSAPAGSPTKPNPAIAAVPAAPKPQPQQQQQPPKPGAAIVAASPVLPTPSSTGANAPILFLVPTCRHSVPPTAVPPPYGDAGAILSTTWVAHVKRANAAVSIFPFVDGAPLRGLHRVALTVRAAVLLPATQMSDAYRQRRSDTHCALSAAMQAVPRAERVPAPVLQVLRKVAALQHLQPAAGAAAITPTRDVDVSKKIELDL